MAKQSVLLDIDGVQLTRECFKRNTFYSMLAFASKAYRKRNHKASFRPGLHNPVNDERFDQFFFPLEVSWVPIEGSLRETRWRAVIFTLPFEYSDLTEKGIKQIQFLIDNEFIPNWDVIFGEKLKIWTSLSYVELFKELTRTTERVYYKGGIYEKFMAQILRIPSVNMELYGVPKLFSFYDWIRAPGTGMPCQLHKDRKHIHCPRVEVFSIKNYCIITGIKLHTNKGYVKGINYSMDYV